MRPRLGSYAAASVSVAATLWLMIQARGVLEPLVIALLLWFLINAGAGVYARAIHGEAARPGRLPRLLSAASGLVIIAVLSIMTANSVSSLRANLPVYEENLRAMVARVGDGLGLEGLLDVQQIAERIELGNVALTVAGTALGFFGSLVVIIVYVLFIFVEEANYRAKLAALAPESAAYERLSETARRIREDVETYIGVKCVIGAAQAVPTFVVLWLVGLDAAAFWAVVIFFFSFVPTIGSLVGIVFPAMMALVQFTSVGPFLVTVTLLAVIQVWGSNWLEPVLMGDSLNLSPLVILIAIFAGGAVWGVTGAIVAVPALSVAVLVFSRIESMRPVAILLTADGKV
jgi:predicted PurR-regulated permease PerM